MHADTTTKFAIALRDETDALYSAPVINACIMESGATLLASFPRSACPKLDILQQIELSLSGESLTTPLQTQGRVVFSSRSAASHDFEFQLGYDAQALLAPALNRRSAVRVRPAQDDPIELSLRTSQGQEIHPVVNDVSITGVGIFLTQDEELLLAPHWQVELVLRLPEEDVELELSGNISYRRLRGSTILYGIEFDPDRSLVFRLRQETLQRYVMRRHVELLGRLKKWNAG